MATDVTLIVLPSFTGGEGAGQPQIFLEQKGIWCNVSPREPAEVSQSKSVVDKTLKRMMTTIGAKGASPSVWPPLQALCQKLLYEVLVHGLLHEELQAAAATADGDDLPILRIHTPIDWIPWELMHDGTDFLGLRFCIARLPIVRKAPDLGNHQPHTVHRIYNLLAKHLYPVADDGLFAKWETTFSGVVAHPGQEIRFPSADGPGNNYPSLADLENAQDPDILHITCHGGEVDTEDSKVYWTLDHTQPFWDAYRVKDYTVEYLGQTMSIFDTRPLVFGNTCASVKAEPGEKPSGGAGLVTSFGATFFAQGAVAFVGTFVPITEKLSVEFPCQFYQKLLGEALPIGKALWATKRHFADQGENDPSWLFYCLYGPPETRFQMAESPAGSP